MAHKIAPRPESFTPAGKRILILPQEAENKSMGGILLPENTKERPQVGTVISIGPEVELYKADDLVLYGKSAGVKIDFEISIDGNGNPEYREFWLMQESELFGRL